MPATRVVPLTCWDDWLKIPGKVSGAAAMKEASVSNESSVTLQDHAGNRVFWRVRDGERGIFCAELVREFCCPAMELYCGPAAGLAKNLDITPAHTTVPSRTQGLHGCFFCCESCRVPFDAIGFGIAISNLFFGEN